MWHALSPVGVYIYPMGVEVRMIQFSQRDMDRKCNRGVVIWHASESPHHQAAQCAACIDRRRTRSGALLSHRACTQCTRCERTFDAVDAPRCPASPTTGTPPLLCCPPAARCATGAVVKFLVSPNRGKIGVVVAEVGGGQRCVVEFLNFKTRGVIAAPRKGVFAPLRLSWFAQQHDTVEVHTDEVDVISTDLHCLSNEDSLNIRAALSFDLAVRRRPWRHTPTLARLLCTHQQTSVMAFHHLQVCDAGQRRCTPTASMIVHVHPDRMAAPLRHARFNGWIDAAQFERLNAFYNDAFHRLSRCRNYV